jgi:hypothetical protein
MIKNYVKNKKVRAALSIETEMMQRVPEVTNHNFRIRFDKASTTYLCMLS